jgi:hypothetical protein
MTTPRHPLRVSKGRAGVSRLSLITDLGGNTGVKGAVWSAAGACDGSPGGGDGAAGSVIWPVIDG